MKTLGIILCLLSFNVYAKDLVCTSSTRVETTNVEFKEEANGKVYLIINQVNYLKEGLTDFELIGYKVNTKSETPIFNLNNETIYNLVDENGVPSEFIITKTFGGAQSRVPCYETRAPIPSCNTPISSNTYISLKSKAINIAFSCN
ncbi:MAG: hypothetical protein ACJAS4_000978 [Bacteriovoracaceae bacterium]|jgi:hypothetical protein